MAKIHGQAAHSVVADRVGGIFSDSNSLPDDPFCGFMGKRVAEKPGGAATRLLVLAQLHDSGDVLVPRSASAGDEQRQL